MSGSHAFPGRRALLASLCLVLPIAGCDSRGATSGPTGPSAPSPTPLTVSGQVFELIPGSRVPAAAFPVLVVVRPLGGGMWTYRQTTTGPDGRYDVPQLPGGTAVVLANSATYHQVCGASAPVTAATRIDVEITSRANPQPSATLPSLRVIGQIYETTPAGRVGISNSGIGIYWAPDAPFLDVEADADGRYLACGIPIGWPIAFWTGKEGYQDRYDWHQFSVDTTLDIELKRR